MQALCLYLVWRNLISWSKSTSPQIDNSGLLNQINQTNLNLLGQISDKINSFSLNQAEQNNGNFQKLEKRFSQLELQIQDRLNSELGKIQQLQLQSEQNLSTKFEKQLGQQKMEFGIVRENNQEGLQKLQESVRQQLSSSIQNLIDLNKSELSSLRESNKQNIQLLSNTNQEKLKQMEDAINAKLSDSFAQNMVSLQEVNKNLGSMQSTAEKMIDSTKSVERLNSIFDRTSSKAFGNFGENYLETLLAEHLYEDQWEKQVSIPESSDKIDFVITIGDKKIGIDSKFPLTKFQDFIEANEADKNKFRREYIQSLLLMAKDISRKYGKGHLDLLWLYLPSESMYAEAVSDNKIMEELQKIRVNLTSPTTLFPLLALVQAYRFKYEVNQRAEEIVDGLKRLKKNVMAFREDFDKLGDKLRLAQTNYDSSQKNLGVVQSSIFKLEAPVAGSLIETEISLSVPAVNALFDSADESLVS